MYAAGAAFVKRPGRAMLREDLNDALKQAKRSGDSVTTSTLRLVLAALKDRDIAARNAGASEGIGDTEIRRMLAKLVQQSREAAAAYEAEGRTDLAAKERREIAVLQRFLPRALDDAETRAAVDEAIRAAGARGIKDVGPVMRHLHAAYPGRMDFSHASAIAKDKLS